MDKYDNVEELPFRLDNGNLMKITGLDGERVPGNDELIAEEESKNDNENDEDGDDDEDEVDAENERGLERRSKRCKDWCVKRPQEEIQLINVL